MNELKIREIDITLWNKVRISFTPNDDVNIIVGINGSGKTSLLDKIEQTYLFSRKDKIPYVYVPSIDNLVLKDKRKKSSALSQDLDSFIYDMKTGPSIMYYRMSMLDMTPAIQKKVKDRINGFCELVNSLFSDTGKHISIEGNRFIINAGGTLLSTDNLSSGEKQILLLLLRVFLLEEKESVILIDEPENSLDISWQYKLVDILAGLNPKAQFFITTHSPSIFSDGWGDKIIYMEDVTTNILHETAT